jgi:hypothetical protein
MKSNRRRWAFPLLVTVLLVSNASLRAEDEDDGFTPRTGAPPAQRTGGASRSENKAPNVLILAPAETMGMTVRAQPVVYYYVSADTDASVEIGLTATKDVENPVLETKIKGPTKSGLHKLDLAKFKQDGKPVKLEPGVKYDLAITVVASETSASENPTATCHLTRLDPKEAPAGTSDEKDPARRAVAFAKAGIWFDYIDAMNVAIEAKPKDEALLQKRAKALASQKLIWKPDETIIELPAKSSK